MIRTYCTTIAGSMRHKQSRVMLDRLGYPYEFVSATTAEDAPLEECRKMQRWKDYIHRDYPIEYIIRSWACKQTMARAMQKVYDDGNEWALVIQDDIMLADRWYELAIQMIEYVPDWAGSIAICHRGGFDPHGVALAGGRFYKSWNVNLTEQAQLIRRWYAKENAEAMRTFPAESDWCYTMKHDGTPVVFSTTVLGKQRPVPSTIDFPIPHTDQRRIVTD